MNLIPDSPLKFDFIPPIYNWIYPLSGRPLRNLTSSQKMDMLSNLETPTSRAIYVHIPFCETICTFCPFVRSPNVRREGIDAYVRALVAEILLKGQSGGMSNAPIGAIFFGGGTPSILNPEEIRTIGAALHKVFDLSAVREFSVEFEVKSVTKEKIVAYREIGATHARFGLQTFSERYRQLFNLTSTQEQIAHSADLLLDSFPVVSADLLYGFNGQDVQDLETDLEQMVELNLPNIDAYPINNTAIQPKLSERYRNLGLGPMEGLTKHYFGLFVRHVLGLYGYLPHNGHGYTKVEPSELAANPAVTQAYSFVYHEHAYGYPEHDIVGFGVNAISSYKGLSGYNCPSIKKYISLVHETELPTSLCCHEDEIEASRSACLALPYHGRCPKEWVSQYPDGSRITDLIAAGLVIDEGKEYALTHEGWAWYTSIMYYLLPRSERRCLDSAIRNSYLDKRRDVESPIVREFSVW